ncbi:CBO0543 family protein [Ammoniphilus sp. YIM 78166]|uniref:CBO0543 family protein n=1 Tax=Ammoniphilus sp. YIM 78166 TaxID=1644106 RepID=UPI001070237B|nr:CBO0543 family protein [Ammoniphilus sp. YIM 78166]
MSDPDAKVKAAYDLLSKANDQMVQVWIAEIVFTWRWWIGLGLTIIPWVIWILFRKKESTWRLMCAGFAVIIMSSWGDFIGISTGSWYYKWEVIPTIPTYLPYDFTLLPVMVMFFLQYKPDMNPLSKAVVFAAIVAFMGERFFIWLDVYEPKGWKHIYSFPIFIIIYLIAHYICTRKFYEKI